MQRLCGFCILHVHFSFFFAAQLKLFVFFSWLSLHSGIIEKLRFTALPMLRQGAFQTERVVVWFSFHFEGIFNLFEHWNFRVNYETVLNNAIWAHWTNECTWIGCSFATPCAYPAACFAYATVFPSNTPVTYDCPALSHVQRCFCQILSTFLMLLVLLVRRSKSCHNIPYSMLTTFQSVF